MSVHLTVLFLIATAETIVTFEDTC